MLKRKAGQSYQNRRFKRPRQTAGAAMYNTFARAGAFARPTAPRRTAARGMVNQEVKGVDIALTQAPAIITTTTTNANSILLNGIAPGTGSFNRVGRKVVLKTLRLKGAALITQTPSAAGAISPGSLRMVVVWDQQPSGGTIPTWDVIFGITAQDGTESSTVLAPLRYDNMDRFTVLKDKIIDFDSVPGNVVSTASVSTLKSFDEYISLKNRTSVYSGQSAPCTIADISTGGLYVYFRAQNSDGTVALSIDADSFARLRYTD